MVCVVVVDGRGRCWARGGSHTEDLFADFGHACGGGLLLDGGMHPRVNVGDMATFHSEPIPMSSMPWHVLDNPSKLP